MQKRKLIIIELEQEEQEPSIINNKDFQINFQQAILLSLLEKKQLTQWQYEMCLEELR